MTLRRKTAMFVFILTAFVLTVIPAQEFGFTFDDSASDNSDAAVSSARSELPFKFKFSGEIQAGIQVFVHDFKKTENQESAFNALDTLSAKFNFNITGVNADAFLNFNLNSASIGEFLDRDGNPNPAYTPRIIDQAYLCAYMGTLDIEAGLRKLTWGKADSMGPLDVVNPIDYSNLTDIMLVNTLKIARPMIHASMGLGDFSKLEAVFLPNFSGHRFAQKGRWAPAQLTNINKTLSAGILDHALETYGPGILGDPNFAAQLSQVKQYFENARTNLPETGGLEYFQTGLRFTTIIKSTDLGFQYFYGNLFRPVYSIPKIDSFFYSVSTGAPQYSLLAPYIEYTRYHQFGMDYAQVLWSFNMRAELAFHLTKDIAGNDGKVANPFIAWSLGFDRELVWGINANVQCNETVRLFQNRVKNNPALDCEGGTKTTATRLMLQLSRKFIKDEIECKATAIWDIEEFSSYIIPSAAWSKNDISAELAAGVFAGNATGEMGQYWENTFLRLKLTYTF